MTSPLSRAHEGVLLYGLTPPRSATSPERADEIAARTLGRLAALDLDALILYDVDAEAERADTARPFPFAPMMDPVVFRERHLSAWRRPVVMYRAVGKYDPEELRTWFATSQGDPNTLAVLVGASSASTPRPDPGYPWAAWSSPSGTTAGATSTFDCCASRRPGVRSSCRRFATTSTTRATCSPTTATPAATGESSRLP
jgi:hypothetical protein